MEMVSFLLLLALGSPHTRKWIDVMKKDIDLIKQHHRRSRSLFQRDSAVTAQRRRQVADLFGALLGGLQLSRSFEAPKARPEQTPKAPHAPERIPRSAPDTAVGAEHQRKIMKLLRGFRKSDRPSKVETPKSLPGVTSLQPRNQTYDSWPLLIQRPLLIFSKEYVDETLQSLWKNKASKYNNAGSMVTALLAPVVFGVVSEKEKKKEGAKAN